MITVFGSHVFMQNWLLLLIQQLWKRIRLMRRSRRLQLKSTPLNRWKVLLSSLELDREDARGGSLFCTWESSCYVELHEKLFVSVDMKTSVWSGAGVYTQCGMRNGRCYGFASVSFVVSCLSII